MHAHTRGYILTYKSSKCSVVGIARLATIGLYSALQDSCPLEGVDKQWLSRPTRTKASSLHSDISSLIRIFVRDAPINQWCSVLLLARFLRIQQTVLLLSSHVSIHTIT